MRELKNIWIAYEMCCSAATILVLSQSLVPLSIRVPNCNSWWNTPRWEDKIRSSLFAGPHHNKESEILTARGKEMLSTQTINHILRLCVLCVSTSERFGCECEALIKQKRGLSHSEHRGVVQCSTAVCGHKSCHFLTVHFLLLAEAFSLSWWLISLLHFKTAATEVCM